MVQQFNTRVTVKPSKVISKKQKTIITLKQKI